MTATWSIAQQHTWAEAATWADPFPVDSGGPISSAWNLGAITWASFDLRSRQLIARIPEVSGTVKRRIGKYDTGTLTVPTPLAGLGAFGPPSATLKQRQQLADAALAEGRTLIVAIIAGEPAWAGIVTRVKGGSGLTREVSWITPEGYLDRRYVGNHNLVNVDESAIVAALVGEANVEGIGIVLDAPPTGTTRTRQYFDKDDSTVYARLDELSKVLGGPEWTIDPVWEDETATAIRLVLRLRRRIGIAADAPTAVWKTTANARWTSGGPGNPAYEHTKDYGAGVGANHVIATGDGEGDARPQSPPQRDEELLAQGWPRWEERYSPGSSISSVNTLISHARARLAKTRLGARTTTLAAKWDAYPRLGVDWRMGDDVAWSVFGHMHPTGFAGQARAWGFELDSAAGTITPLIAAGEEGS